MRLRYLPAEAIATNELATALRKLRLNVSVNQSVQNPWIALTSDWTSYYGARSRRLKKATNLAANRMARAGTVTLEWLAPGQGTPLDVERALAILTDISSRSWKQGTGNSLDHPGPQAFIQRLAAHAHRRGWLSTFTLALDGKPVATEFQIVDGRDVYALRADFDGALEELSPGSHLSRLLLERLFGRAFHRYYMGPGVNAYKYRWAEGSDPVYSLTLYGSSPRGRALACWELALKPALRGIRDRLRAAPNRATGDDEDVSQPGKSGSKPP